MVVDTADYVGVDNNSEKGPVAIISSDNLEQEADQLQDLPLANDRTSFLENHMHREKSFWEMADRMLTLALEQMRQ